MRLKFVPSGTPMHWYLCVPEDGSGLGGRDWRWLKKPRSWPDVLTFRYNITNVRRWFDEGHYEIQIHTNAHA